MNVLRRLLLGSGRFPDELGTALRAEGVELLEEGLSGSVTFRDYKAPGRRYSLRKVALDEPDRVRLGYSAQAFHGDRSGTVELRFTTPRAAWLVERLTAIGARTE